MASSLYFDREVVCSFEDWTRELFLTWYPGQEDKWRVFQKIRHDWISKYGSLKQVIDVNGRKITFFSKVIWSFRFMECNSTIRV